MSKKRAPGRSLDEWMELVTEWDISLLFLQCSYPSPQKSLSDTGSSPQSQHS